MKQASPLNLGKPLLGIREVARSEISSKQNSPGIAELTWTSLHKSKADDKYKP
jgi:hypothetical protein